MTRDSLLKLKEEVLERGVWTDAAEDQLADVKQRLRQMGVDDEERGWL